MAAKFRRSVARGLATKGKFTKKPARAGSTSWARLNIFNKGVVWGMHVAGLERSDMAAHVQKTDGSKPALHAIDDVVAKKTADPKWEGETTHTGRPRELNVKEEKALVKLVFKMRGKTKVTIPYCQKKLLFLRRVDATTVGRALERAGLAWLTRRLKSWVPPQHKEERLCYARSLKNRREATMHRFGFTDGTTFYLARCDDEVAQKQRGALGKMVWRMASGRDGLWDANVGASLYAKAQGLPVKIWGFLANGRLEYFVLPRDGPKKTTHMNGTRYNDMVQSKFAAWRHNCFRDNLPVYLIQDHEGCLWQKRNLDALRGAGFIVEPFPKSSPDLNAIEGIWAHLRQLLAEREPTQRETRAEFLVRLRRTVTWMNDNKKKNMLCLCRNLKERADDVIENLGAKTKW
jgi:transposase